MNHHLMKHWISDYTRSISSADHPTLTARELQALLDCERPAISVAGATLRLQGSQVRPETLTRLDQMGAFEHLTRLELVSAVVTAPLWAMLTTLPLRALRLEAVTDDGSAPKPLEDLEVLELQRCSTKLGQHLLANTPKLSELIVVSPLDDDAGLNALLDTLSTRKLGALTLAKLPASSAQLRQALEHSAEHRLTRLGLIQVQGLNDSNWLRDLDWPHLGSLAWMSQNLPRIEEPLPTSLRDLSLAHSAVEAFHVATLPESLEAFDARYARLPASLYERLANQPSRWRHLGLSGGEAQSTLLSAVSAAPDSRLTSLTLAHSIDGASPSTTCWRAQETIHLEALREVSIQGWTLDHHVWGALLQGRGAPNLERLDWSGYLHFEWLPGESLSPSLRQLALSGGGSFEVGAQDTPLALELLSIDSLALTGDLGAFLQSCPRLETLLLEMTAGLEVSWLEEAMPALAPRLKSLGITMFQSAMVFDEEVLEEGQRLGAALTQAPMPRLKDLRLNENPIDAASFRCLIHRKMTPDLEHLHFGPEPMDEETWRALVNHTSPRLHTISVPSEASDAIREDLLRSAGLSHVRVSLF